MIQENLKQDMQCWIACHDCDYLYQLSPLATNTRAICKRCGGILDEQKINSVERATALTIAALILFVVANTLPFLALQLQGQTTETTLLTGVKILFLNDMSLLAGLVLLTTFIAPLIELCIFLYVLFPIRFSRQSKYMAQALRTLQWFDPWSMMEVFMLGILVAIVKLSSMAMIVPGIAIWSFVLLIFVLAAINSVLDLRLLWRTIDGGK